VTGNFLFWVGFLGLILGMFLGLSSLDEGSPASRRVMLGIGIAILIFIYILQLGVEKAPGPGLTGLPTIWPPVLSFLMGAIAGLVMALCAGGNVRAALLASGLAGLVSYFMGVYLPPGSIGPPGPHDIAAAIDIGITMLVGGSTYYLLRNWGRGGEQWD